MTILIILLVVGALLLYAGIKVDFDPIIVIGFMIVVLDIVVGFGAYGCLQPVGDPVYTKIAPTEIMISSSEVIVKFRDNAGPAEVRDSNYISMVNAKSNNIEVLKKETKNTYGVQLMPTYTVIVKDK